MTDLKIYFFNAAALALSLVEINPLLQFVSLLLAIVYTMLQIIKKIKEWQK